MDFSSIATSPTVGNAAFAAVSGVTSYISSQKQAEDLAQKFSKGSLKRLAHTNPALRKKYHELDDEWKGSVVGAIFSLALGSAIGALVGFFVPIWGAAFVGTLIGGFLGNKLYTDAFVEQAQDPVMINAQIIDMRKNGEAVPAEAVFAALAANLSGEQGKLVGKKLKRYAGTDLFTEALANPKNIAGLQAFIHDKDTDNAIRAKTGMPLDPANPNKTVAEQYAELINSGQMKPERMLNVGEGMYVLEAMAHGVSYNVDVPAIPEVPTRRRNR